jgi:hypothetical protein
VTATELKPSILFYTVRQNGLEELSMIGAVINLNLWRQWVVQILSQDGGIKAAALVEDRVVILRSGLHDGALLSHTISNQ